MLNLLVVALASYSVQTSSHLTVTIHLFVFFKGLHQFQFHRLCSINIASAAVIMHNDYTLQVLFMLKKYIWNSDTLLIFIIQHQKFALQHLPWRCFTGIG